MAGPDVFSNPTNFRPFQKFLLNYGDGGGGGVSPTMDLTGLLAGMRLAQQVQQTPQQPQLSPVNSLMLGGPSEVVNLPTGGPPEEEEGVLSRLFSAIDAPQNAVVNTFEEFTTDNEEGGWLKELGSDLLESGKSLAGGAYQISPLNLVPMPGDFLDEAAAKANPANSVAKQLRRLDYFKDDQHPWLREGLGFAGDVLSDPLTYAGGFGLLRRGASKVIPALAKETTQRKAADELARRAALEQPEEIIESAARGEAPIVKPLAREMGDNIDPMTEKRVIQERPLRAHFDDLAPKVTGRDKDLYTTDQADELISGAFGTKLAGEQRFIADDAARKLGTPDTESVKRGADLARKLMDEVHPAMVAGGAENANALIPSNLFTMIHSAAKQANKTPKKGVIREGPAWKSAVQEFKAGEDFIVESQKLLPDTNPNRLDFQFAGENIRLGDVLAKAPVPKTLAERNQLEVLVGQYATGKLTPTTHPLLKRAVDEARATKVMAKPGFAKEYSRVLNSEIGKVIEKKGLPFLTPEVQAKLQTRAIRTATKNQAMRKSGGSYYDVRSANAIAKVVEKHVTDIPQNHMEEMYAKAAEKSLVDEISHETIEATTKAIERQLGPLKKMHDKYGAQNGVPTTIFARFGLGFMSKFTTWHNTYGMERWVKSAVLHGAMSARMRHKTARELLKKYNKEELTEAFEIWQGKLARGSSDAADRAYLEIDRWMTELIGNPSFKQTGTLQKSNVLMAHVNKELDRLWGKDTAGFRFRNDTWTDKETGITWDFRHPDEGGRGWWESPKSWDMKKASKDHRSSNPIHSIYDLDLAIERQAKLFATLEDGAARFGRRHPSGDFKYQVLDDKGKPHPVFEGWYLDEATRDGMQNVIKHYEKGSWAPKSKYGRFWSKALRAWKSGVTIYNPSHHIRNFIGDMWMTWNAGHSNIFDFYRGMRVMNAYRKHYKRAVVEGNWEEVGKFTGTTSGALDAKFDSIIFRVNGKDIKASDLYDGAFKRGLLLEFDDLEDLKTEGIAADLFGSFKPAGGHVRAFATKAAEYREHTIRIHHFTAAVRKNMGKGMTREKAMDEAAFEVRKWHPDGTDLTQFEQKWMRNVFPFYSWQRKAIPLVMESLIVNPAKIVAYPRAQTALSSALGVQDNETNDLLDPFPDSHLFPEWMREAGIGPLGLYAAGGISGQVGEFANLGTNATGGQFGATVINPSNPFNDLVADFAGMGTFGDLKQGPTSLMNPALRIAAETLTETETSGVPIEYDPAGYVAEQIPHLAVANRIFPGIAGGVAQQFGAPAPKLEKHGQFNPESFWNWLTAGGIQGSGQYKKSTEFEAKERAKNAAKQGTS